MDKGNFSRFVVVLPQFEDNPTFILKNLLRIPIVSVSILFRFRFESKIDPINFESDLQEKFA